MVRMRNKAFLAAMRKGYLAAFDGKPLNACPYFDHRTLNGSVTFSRAFIHAWEEGWHMAKADMARGDYDGWYEERAQGRRLG